MLFSIFTCNITYTLHRHIKSKVHVQASTCWNVITKEEQQKYKKILKEYINKFKVKCNDLKPVQNVNVNVNVNESPNNSSTNGISNEINEINIGNVNQSINDNNICNINDDSNIRESNEDECKNTLTDDEDASNPHFNLFNQLKYLSNTVNEKLINDRSKKFILNRLKYLYENKIDFNITTQFMEYGEIQKLKKGLNKNIVNKYVLWVLFMIVRSLQLRMGLKQISVIIMSVCEFFGIQIKYISNHSLKIFIICLYISIETLINSRVRNASNWLLVDSSKKKKEAVTCYILKSTLNCESKYIYIKCVSNNKSANNIYHLKRIDGEYYNTINKVQDISADVNSIQNTYGIRINGFTSDHAYLKYNKQDIRVMYNYIYMSTHMYYYHLC